MPQIFLKLLIFSCYFILFLLQSIIPRQFGDSFSLIIPEKSVNLHLSVGQLKDLAKSFAGCINLIEFNSLTRRPKAKSRKVSEKCQKKLRGKRKAEAGRQR